MKGVWVIRAALFTDSLKPKTLCPEAFTVSELTQSEQLVKNQKLFNISGLFVLYIFFYSLLL